MMITKLKLLILHMMFVAVTGTSRGLVRRSLNKALANDLKVVFTALERTNPHKLGLTLGALETSSSTTRFVHRDMDRIRRVMTGFSELDLTGMNLTRLPTYGIQMMARLEKVILNDNEGLEITPNVIKMIGLLPIKELSIQNSKISPETFRALLNLPNLTKLDISGNESLSTYTGSDKFGNLTTSLVELRAANCDFDNSWLDAILGCTNLKFLDVSGNTRLFENKDPNAYCSFMKGLAGLSVSGCALGSEWLDVILKCANLTALNVSKNSRLFENKDPSTGYSFMRGLSSLDVSWCRLSSAWLCDILGCTSLVDLDMSYNDDIGVDHGNFSKFENLNSLKKLKLDGCNLMTENLNMVCKCGGLVELSVSSNRRLWTGVVDFGTCRKSLRVLKADSTGLDENVLRILCGLPNAVSHDNSTHRTMEEDGFPNMAILEINCNPTLGRVISQEGFSFGCLEKTLTELCVASIGITSNSAVKAISRCKGLLKLDASYNTELWGGANRIDFGFMKSGLQVLDVRFTELSPAILSEIFEFDQLVELNISNNDTACGGLGSNNRILGDVKNTLRKIDVGKTGLTGEGLQWIFREFKGLKEVNARYNRHITPIGLMRLDFSTLANRLVEFYVRTDSRTLSDLQKKLPMTRIYTTNS